MSPTSRVLAGIPAGGQFAPTSRSEPAISLGSTFSPDIIRQITNRHEGGGAPFIDLTEYQLAAVRNHIDQTGDFSHTAVSKAAEEAYFLEHRYTPAERQEYVRGRGDSSAYYGDPEALRRDIEQMRKDKTDTTPAAPNRKQP
jgi:hypothetical protein